MRRNDYILGGFFLVLAALMMVFFFLRPDTEGSRIVIQKDGEIIGEYSLRENREIPISEHNILVVKDGKADMVWADCPDKLCVAQKNICKTNESIVCLPNRVVITVVGSNADTEMDAIVR